MKTYTVKRHTHRNKNTTFNTLTTLENGEFVESTTFTPEEWRAFRCGAGRGVKVTQDDLQAFADFLDRGMYDYHAQCDTGLTKIMWRRAVLTCYKD